MIDINEEHLDTHKNAFELEEDISIKDDFAKIDSFLKQKAPQKNFIAHDNSELKEAKKQNQLDSKMLNEPIIDKAIFEKSLNVKNVKIDFSRLTYPNLKQIISKFGFYDGKIRMYMWKFLLSLPNDNDLYNLYAKKGIHPFYQNISDRFPIADKKYFRKTQLLCSLLSYWSPHIGNVYYLPNLVFPFIKSLPWDDLFILEVIIALLNSTCDYWFELYPSPPHTHLTYCESIIQKESNELYEAISKQINIKTIIWRMLMNIFSESFDKDNWLSLIDFFITNNHKPEMILYFSIAFILSKQLELNNERLNINHIKKVLFKPMINSSVKQMVKLYQSTLNLYSKYSKNQVVKYKPHKPFPPNDYPKIDKFPLDFLKTIAELKESLLDEASFSKTIDSFNERRDNIQMLHKEFEDLRINEKELSECYGRMIRTEKEKTEIVKREFGLIMHNKKKVYDELKKSKLSQLNSINNAIKNSIGLTNKISKEQQRRNELDLMLKKEYEQFDLKNRLMNEEMNNYEYNSNSKMMNLLNQRIHEETDKGKEEINRLRTKQNNLCDRLVMNGNQIDEDDIVKRNEVDEAVRVYEIETKRNKFKNDVDLYKDQMKNYQIELKNQKNRDISQQIQERERDIRLENDNILQRQKHSPEANEYYDNYNSNPFIAPNISGYGAGYVGLNEKEKLDLIEKYRNINPNQYAELQ